MIRIPKRVTRLFFFTLTIIFILCLYHNTGSSTTIDLNDLTNSLTTNKIANDNIDNDNIDISNGLKLKFKHHKNKPREEVIEENYNELVSILKSPITEPKLDNLVRPINPSTYKLANATLMIMAKNSELRGVLYTMKQIEEKFNSKFHYPYVFLNDGEFNDNFKKRVEKLTKSEIFFEKIEPEIWKQPNWIDKERQSKEMKVLKKQNIAYANKVSYHNMCRYYSVNFFNHPRMQQFKYYWRFEPNTDYFCDIDYDVFKFMESNKKVYGFVISLYDAQETMKTLWPETLKFINKNKNLLNPNAAIDFLTEDMQNPEKTQFTNGYSTCHFWSNFEIADMDFYRGEAYNSWVNYLDSTGGFYYERWGDAPVHSIGVSLFADKNDVHWFRDIGYKHHPYTNCPNSNRCHGCEPGRFTYDHLKDQNCISNWWNFEMDDNTRSLY